MSADSHAEFPVYEPPSRFRWVPPLMIGVCLGALLGGAAVLAVMLLKDRRSGELVAQHFNVTHVLNAVPGSGEVVSTGDTTEHLGRTDHRSGSGSAVRREIHLQGPLPKGTDPGTFAHQLADQIEAELSRQGAFRSGGSSSSSSRPNEARHTRDMSYYTRDKRRGFLDLNLTVRDGRVEGTLILTEGR